MEDDDNDSDDEEDSGTAEAMEVLSRTRWDAELPVVKAARAKLYAPLRLSPPDTAANTIKAGNGASAKKQQTDEHESYASLVDSAGY